MRRNMDLIRKMLKNLAENDVLNESDCRTGYSTDTGEVTRKDYLEHIRLLIEANFVVGEVFRAEGDEIVNAEIYYITWSGYEYLSSISDDEVWAKVKKKMEIVKNLSAHVIKELASEVAKQTLLK